MVFQIWNDLGSSGGTIDHGPASFRPCGSRSLSVAGGWANSAFWLVPHLNTCLSGGSEKGHGKPSGQCFTLPPAIEVRALQHTEFCTRAESCDGG
jgi:hypothetical protein